MLPDKAIAYIINVTCRYPVRLLDKRQFSRFVASTKIAQNVIAEMELAFPLQKNRCAP